MITLSEEDFELIKKEVQFLDKLVLNCARVLSTLRPLVEKLDVEKQKEIASKTDIANPTMKVGVAVEKENAPVVAKEEVIQAPSALRGVTPFFTTYDDFPYIQVETKKEGEIKKVGQKEVDSLIDIAKNLALSQVEDLKNEVVSKIHQLPVSPEVAHELLKPKTPDLSDLLRLFFAPNVLSGATGFITHSKEIGVYEEDLFRVRLSDLIQYPSGFYRDIGSGGTQFLVSLSGYHAINNPVLILSNIDSSPSAHRLYYKEPRSNPTVTLLSLDTTDPLDLSLIVRLLNNLKENYF